MTDTANNAPAETTPAATTQAAGTPDKQSQLPLITGPQLEIPEVVDPLLAVILGWPRKHLTLSEVRFRAWLAAHINEITGPTNRVQYLAEAVMYVHIPSEGEKQSTTLFSCHIDTCDSALDGDLVPGEKHGMTQHKKKGLMYDNNFGTIFLDKDNPVGSCLGADDGVGVWIMLEMLQRGVPGGYMFHTGEECGGVGSRAVLAKNTDILKKYEVAIAFDRPRTNEVITHQGSLRCASDKMGEALAAALNKFGFDYKTSPHGTFTDTKMYRGVIAECLNLGVGYEKQHGRAETLDYAHAFALREALCTINWNALPVDRDPAAPDPRPSYGGSYGGRYGWGGRSGMGGGMGWPEDDLDDGLGGNVFGGGSVFRDINGTRTPLLSPFEVAKKKGKKGKKGQQNQPQTDRNPPDYVPSESAYDTLMGGTYDDIVFGCQEEPELMSESIVDLMLEIARLRAEVSVLKTLNQRG